MLQNASFTAYRFLFIKEKPTGGKNIPKIRVNICSNLRNFKERYRKTKVYKFIRQNYGLQ